MAITGEPDGHQWGPWMAASGEKSMAIDSQGTPLGCEPAHKPGSHDPRLPRLP